MGYLKTVNIIFLLTIITGIDARYDYDVWTYAWGLNTVIWIVIFIKELYSDSVNEC